MIRYRRLPLEKLDNARELGGFPAAEGVTAYGKYIRSEVPAALTGGDIAFLKEYGLKMVLDFRGSVELEKTPDVLAKEDWLEYVHLPMFDDTASRGMAGGRFAALPPDFSWGKYYVEMADARKPWVKSLLEAVARCDGAVLIHCTTGKDRTGIAAALLLGLCGVSDNDIAADYCVSQIYLQNMYKTMTHLMPTGSTSDMSDPFFSTAPENMLMLLEFMGKAYGGIAGYVRECGVAEETINAILSGFLEK